METTDRSTHPIDHDPTCPTLNAHRVTGGLDRELWAV